MILITIIVHHDYELYISLSNKNDIRNEYNGMEVLTEKEIVTTNVLNILFHNNKFKGFFFFHEIFFETSHRYFFLCYLYVYREVLKII